MFKIAMLNQKMNNFVKSIYEIENYNEFATLHARQSLLELLEETPDLSKYQQNKRFLKNIQGAWASTVFGG